MNHASYTAQCTVDSPLGPILLARTERGLAGLWFDGQKDHPGALSAPRDDEDPILSTARCQLEEYWNGQRKAFDLPLDLHGTEFQRAVWQALLGVPSGRTQSYRDIALQLRSPRATRAVGAAVGRNPVSIVVPCHRIIGSSGALTGYAGGLPRKIALLRLEGVNAA